MKGTNDIMNILHRKIPRVKKGMVDNMQENTLPCSLSSSAQKNLHFNNNVIMSHYSQHFKAFASHTWHVGGTAGKLGVAVFYQQRRLCCPFYS
jgi:hypothetical protein